MNTDKNNRYLKSFTASAIMAITLIAVLTISAEVYKPLKDLLKEMFIHHWIGKGVLSFFGFIIVGFILQSIHAYLPTKERLVKCLTAVTIFCATAIIVFYFYEFFWAH